MKFILAILLVFAVACDQKPAEQPETDEPAAAEKAPEGDKADVPGKVDPPIPVAEVPAGKWYCDMGTAHYMSDEKGDGKCPICNMMLKQKPAGEAPAADGDKPVDHDHDHGEDGHDHDHGDHKH